MATQKKKRGRPTEYPPERIADLLSKLEDYIEKTPLPIVAEFAYINGLHRQRMYDIPELSDTIKKLTSKKEANLEKMATMNKINVSMAIFSLKQLGWSDKQEIDQKTEVTYTVKKPEINTDEH